MTDDEMIACANKLLTREVEKAIKVFNSGFDKSDIRNLRLWVKSENNSRSEILKKRGIIKFGLVFIGI